MNVYFQNGNTNASIGELDTVEFQGLIMNSIQERGIRNESNIAAKYGQQLAPMKGGHINNVLSKQRSHKQSLNGLNNNR